MVVAVAPRRDSRIRAARDAWFAVMTGCFVAGLILGISGLTFSLLTATGVLLNTRSLSFTVTSMIVVSLGLLLFGAHAMDRMDEKSRSGGEDENGEF